MGCKTASGSGVVCIACPHSLSSARVVGVRLPTLSSESAFQKTDSRLLVFHRRTRLFWTPDSLPRHERRTPDSRISPQRDPSQPKNGTPDSDSDSTPGVLLESDSDNSIQCVSRQRTTISLRGIVSIVEVTRTACRSPTQDRKPPTTQKRKA